MGVSDLDARFDQVSVTPGSVAAQLIDKLRAVAHELNDAVQGEPYQLVTVIQQLEVCAFQAARYLDFTDAGPGEPPPDVVDLPPDRYTSKTVAQLVEFLESRGLPTTGNKAELIERLEANDAKRAQT
jgi:SAP domain